MRYNLLWQKGLGIKMVTIQGKGVYGAIAIGQLSFFERSEICVKRERVTDTEHELVRLQKAKEAAKQELSVLYEKAILEIGETNAQIFEIHKMMLDDLDYLDSITNIIENQNMNAEYAVWETGEEFAEIFATMDNDYMKERSSDVKDITKRIVSHLCNVGSTDTLTEPVILVADDLSPSETVVLDKSKILAFVTVHGATNSHTAILARTMNIPALIGVDMDLSTLASGMEAAVDGFAEEFIVEPDGESRSGL